eukprot:COSAG06_NODE_3708_length_4993_cov_33.759297_3_plen_599_part_00
MGALGIERHSVSTRVVKLRRSMDSPKLLPVIGPLIRASASIEDGGAASADPSLGDDHSTGLRSWRASREELGDLPPRRGTSPCAPPRVTVPTNVAAVLQATLGGVLPPPRCCAQRPSARAMRCVPRVWRVRAWCAFWAIAGASAGYFSLIFKDGTFMPAPHLWTIVGYFAVVAYTVVGVVCTMSTYEMAEIVGAMVVAEDEQTGAPALDARLIAEAHGEALELGGVEQLEDARQVQAADLGGAAARQPSRENPSRLFLQGLLQSEVSEAASRVLAQQVRRSLCQALACALVVGFQACMNLTRRGRWEQFISPDSRGQEGEGGMHHGLLLSLIGFFSAFCPCAVIVAGWLIFLKAPCVIVCDRIKFSAARVRQMTSETADYDAIMGYIQEAHELTVRLGVLLSPPLLGCSLMCTGVALQWVFAASMVQYAESNHLDGWIGPTGESLVPHMPVPAWFGCAFVVIQGPVWPLFAGASATIACDELVEAVAALRTSTNAAVLHRHRHASVGNGEPTVAAGAGAGAVIKMASPENLVRITGLMHFSQDVNRGAGVGFLLQPFGALCNRRLVTVRFVWQIVACVGGGMAALFVVVHVVLVGLSK